MTTALLLFLALNLSVRFIGVAIANEAQLPDMSCKGEVNRSDG